MILRRYLCSALSFLRIHQPDCEHCNDLRKCWGDDLRKRLEELREDESLVVMREQSQEDTAQTPPTKRTGTDAS
jgi:hypothetical protein